MNRKRLQTANKNAHTKAGGNTKSILGGGDPVIQSSSLSSTICNLFATIDRLHLQQLALVQARLDRLLMQAEPDFESFEPICLTLGYVIWRRHRLVLAMRRCA